MRFYNEKPERSTCYFWDVDRFQLFTESEKCGLLDSLKVVAEKWKLIEETSIKGGVVEMLENMIKELEKSLK